METNKIALIELGGSHDECLYSQVLYLKKYGYQVQVIFDSRIKVGKQNKTITVISNDPKHPRTILWVKGVVDQATASNQ